MTSKRPPLLLPGDVKLPGEMQEALASEQLVLFVGAGASYAPPSRLPNFRELTRSIHDRFKPAEILDTERRDDQILGHLKSQGHDVHEAARVIIGDPASEPNLLHEALVRVWPDNHALRIVTTNYDTHIDKCAKATRSNTNVWSAPALPLGRSFKGIVHLHGSIGGPDEGFVLTDDDFGRAYITEGWARRFLIGMFQTYHVLFIGYSHNDVVMQYLARGLPPGSRQRYALVKHGEREHWEHFDIEAIEWCPASSDPYAPQTEALDEWGKRNRWSSIQHHDHVKALVAAEPMLDPTEDSYLTRCLDDAARTQAFVDEASSSEWLLWLMGKQQFLELFDPGAELSEAQSLLARWYAETFVTNQPAEALNVYADLGGRMSLGLWVAVTDAIWRAAVATPADLAAWIAVLCDQDRGAHDTLLNYILAKCELPRDRQPLLLLLRHLFIPRTQIRQGIFVPGHPSRVTVDLDVAADRHWMKQLIADVLLPNLDELASELLQISTAALLHYHHIHRALGEATDSSDPMSYMRSAIEPSDQDRFNTDAMLTIDLAREAARALAESLGTMVVADDLFSRGVPILRRLAISLVADSVTLGLDEKISWLLAKELLTVLTYRHEAFAILEGAFSMATQDLKDAVWTVGWAEYERSVDQDRPWESAFAVWINRIDPHFEPAATAVKVFSEKHPDWVPSEHPNYISYLGEVRAIPPSRLPAEVNAEPTYDKLRQLELADQSSFAATRLQDAVTAKIVEDATLGVEILNGAAADEAWDSILWHAVGYGLERAAIPQDLWPSVFDAVSEHPAAETSLQILASVLQGALEAEPPTLPAEQFDAAAEVVIRLVSRFVAEGLDTDDPGDDLMFAALNSWPGRITQYFVQSAGVLEKQERDPCDAPGLRDFAQAVHESSEANWSRVALTTLARLFPYLLDRCPDFARESILPMFDWETPTVAHAAWQGIAYAQWSRQTVEALYRFLPDTARRVGLFEDQAQHGLCNTLAGIAVSYGEDPSAADGWLNSFVADNDDLTRATFARFVHGALDNLGEEEISVLWDAWLREWWHQRIAGFPAPIGPEEALVQLSWVFPLQAHLDEVIELATATPVATTSFGFLDKLAASAIPEAYPTRAAILVSHVLSSRPQWWDLNSIEGILRTASEHGADMDALRKACNSLVGLGGPKLDLCPEE